MGLQWKPPCRICRDLIVTVVIDVGGRRWRIPPVRAHGTACGLSSSAKIISTRTTASWVPRLPQNYLFFYNSFEHQKSPRARDQVYFTV